MSCECNICERSRRFQQIVESLDPIDQEFMNEIYSNLMCSEDDADYYINRYRQSKRYIVSQGLSLADLHDYEKYIVQVDSEIHDMIKPL